jgi:hypothetical protein
MASHGCTPVTHHSPHQRPAPQVQSEHDGWYAEPKPVEFTANVTRFEEVSLMHTLSTLGAPSSSRSRD